MPKKLRQAVENLKVFQPIGDRRLPSAKKYGECVKYFRELAGLTMMQLAKEAYTTYQNVSAIENGKRTKINIETMYIFAVVLKCSIDNLLGITFEKGKILEETSKDKAPEDKVLEDDSAEKETVKDEISGGKAVEPAIDFISPTEGKLYLALNDFCFKCPPLYDVIVCLAEHGTKHDLQRASEILYSGYKEFFETWDVKLNN